MHIYERGRVAVSRPGVVLLKLIKVVRNAPLKGHRIIKKERSDRLAYDKADSSVMK
jgi:hypothetical protein